MLVPEILRSARRYIENYDWIRLIDDWQKDAEKNFWYLHLAITVNVDTPLFPPVSEWYFIADEYFPDSEVKVFPAVENSIQTTLYHQAKNNRISSNGLWRMGDICIRENTLKEFSQMPYGTEELLIASIIRTRQWLEAAASNLLVKEGDRFELPSFLPCNSKSFIFKENSESFAIWTNVKYNIGTVNLCEHKINEYLFFRPTIFYDKTGNYVFHMDWGNYFTKYNNPVKSHLGIWILLNKIPVIKDWQTPSTFSELCEITNDNQINLLEEIKIIVMSNEVKFRDNAHHFLLIGFPIPAFFGSESVQVMWEAIQLPILLGMNEKIIKGFRNNPIGRWETDRRLRLKSDTQLDWCDSSNWDTSAITQRGGLPYIVTRMKVLVIGAGCIGSMISELLVREGVTNIDIVDDDILQIGNLTRHTLSIDDIEQYKADSLCKHLAQINPNVICKSIKERISKRTDASLFSKYELIIDCSAAVQVLDIISTIEWKKDFFFVSASMSVGANNFFITLNHGRRFMFDDFINTINAYTSNDTITNPNTLPRDGIGCWHPAFPARMDDIISGVSLCVKAIQRFIEIDNRSSLVLVFSKNNDSYDSSFHIKEELS